MYREVLPFCDSVEKQGETDRRQTDKQTDRQTGGRGKEEKVIVLYKQQVLIKTVSTHKVNLPVKNKNTNIYFLFDFASE